MLIFFLQQLLNNKTSHACVIKYKTVYCDLVYCWFLVRRIAIWGITSGVTFVTCVSFSRLFESPHTREFARWWRRGVKKDVGREYIQRKAQVWPGTGHANGRFKTLGSWPSMKCVTCRTVSVLVPWWQRALNRVRRFTGSFF